MAVTSSRILNLKPKLCKKRCKACGLDISQGPIYDYNHLRVSNIFWVGLSAIQFDEDEEKIPLTPATPSGRLVQEIETGYRRSFKFYKTNLVKCAPLTGNKIRYPFEHEMSNCFPNFEWELKMLKPSTVFLLGKQVSTFVLKNFTNQKVNLADTFNYKPINIGGTNFIPVHHPSFILVYNRKNLEKYIDSIRKCF